MDELSAHIDWKRGRLTLKDIAWKSPSGAIAGEVEADFVRPRLRLDVKGVLPKETAGVDTLLLKIQMAGGKNPETMEGPFSFVAQSKSAERFRCEGIVGAEKQKIFFQRLVVSHVGRKETVTGEAEILLAEERPLLKGRLNVTGLDSFEGLPFPVSLKASVEGESDFTRYQGSFRIENAREGRSADHLSGSFKGDSQGVDVSTMEGLLLGGTVKGRIGISWDQALSMKGHVEGRNLTPSRIDPEWKGQINLDLDGHVTLRDGKAPEAGLRGRLLESRLHGRELTGAVSARLERGMLRLDHLDLHGRGFDFSARGTLQERVDFTAQISDLSKLVPGTQGSFRGRGWTRLQDRSITCSLEAQGKAISLGGITMGSIDLAAHVDDPRSLSMNFRGTLKNLSYGTFRADAASVEASGHLSSHTVLFEAKWPEGEIRGALEGAYEKGAWQGSLSRLSGKDGVTGSWASDRPAALWLSPQRVKLGSFKATGSEREVLTLDGDLGFSPLNGFVKAEWGQFNLVRLNPFLGERRVTGRSTGEFEAQWSQGVATRLTGDVTFSGTHTFASRTVRFSGGRTKLRWDGAGLEGLGSLVTEDGGQLTARVSSPLPCRLIRPEQGTLEASWKSVDVANFQPWLPPELGIEGKLSGRVSGNWHAGGRFEGSGNLSLENGVVRLRTERGLVQDDLSKARLQWSWKEEGIRGDLLLSFKRHGSVESRFQFPMIPQFPVTVPSRGPVQLFVEGHVAEMGLLQVLLPSWVRESRGRMDVNMTARGTLENPLVQGSLRLSKSEVTLFLPSPEVTSRKPGGDPETEPAQETRFKFEIPDGVVTLGWDEKRLGASWTLALGSGGNFSGRFSSPQPPRLALPEEGRMEASWAGFDLRFLKPWLPAGLDLEGKTSGSVSWDWTGKGSFDGSGDVRIQSGLLRWKTKDGVLTDTLRKAELRWTWKGQELGGNVSVSMAQSGFVEGVFRLPLIARLPVTPSPRGPLSASVEGKIEERGILSSLFPWLLEESRGRHTLLLTMGGTWEKPTLQGRLVLEQAAFTVARKSELNSREPSNPVRIDIPRAQASIDWNEKRLAGSWEVSMNPAGSFRGELSSPQPMRFGLPANGKLIATWEAIDLQFARAWLPHGVTLEGSVSGQIEGQWSPGARVDVSGSVNIGQGGVHWKGQEGTINAALQTADLRWVWRNEDVRGTLSLVLSDYGSVESRFQLPLPARFPVAFRPRNSFDVSVQGRLKEKGLVSALFPGLVQESEGQVELQVQGTGRWEKPSWDGHLKLTEAKTYLPRAGIRIEDLELAARLAGSQIQVTTFRARSGRGIIEGGATIELENWGLRRYRGQLKGERFQTVYFPELQILTNPNITFEGTGEKISVRGDIQIPELLIRDRQGQEVIRPSKDVVIVDMKEPPKPKSSSPVDLDVRILLGDKVFVRMQGAYVRLTGEVALKTGDSDAVVGSGEVRVAEGYYIAFGRRLDISRGVITFKGPVGRPNLDILATRTIKGQIKEVIAGVLVTGNLQSPTVRLYSQPAMPETDILSYIILGEPPAKDRSQTNVWSAAGVLLSAGESVLLDNRVRDLMSEDELKDESEKGWVSRYIDAVSKHIRERFYVSLGGSPFTDSYLITLRYTLSKHFEIETRTGSPDNPGAGILYYRIDFK